MKKNIFFDFGRTLVKHPEDGIGDIIIQKCGITQAEDIKMVKSLAFGVGKFVNFLDEGSMSREEYITNIFNESPERLHEQILKVVNYHISELPLIDGVEDLLKKLRSDGYKLYITSNLDEYHTKQMYTAEIAKYFDGMIFSSEIKIRKPHKGFFEAAFERFGVKAQDCLFIDDLEENVKGAQKCGIKGFVFDGKPKSAEKFIYENS